MWFVWVLSCLSVMGLWTIGIGPWMNPYLQVIWAEVDRVGLYEGSSKTTDESRPNIILIMADDMGWGDLGANWKKTKDTPNLDNLAKSGLRMTDFHAGASVCAPSRAALLTGRLGMRTGVVENFSNKAVGGLPRNETTLANILLNAGYHTAMLGKWHLGMQPGYHPLDRGFQSYLGVPYSIDMGCTDPPGDNLPKCAACPSDNDVGVPNFEDKLLSCFEDLALPLFEDKEIKHQPLKLSSLSTKYAEFGTNFIYNRSQEEKPFFLYAALSHVHVPLGCSSRFKNSTGHGIFSDILHEMDWLVGKLTSAAMHSTRNTLIWFISDNGPWEVKCDLAGSWGVFSGEWQRSKAGGGGGSASKQTVWEGGHRVPSVVYWPGVVKAGWTSDALTSSLDILPTLVSIAGLRLPKDRSFDGYDLSPLLKQDQPKFGHEVLFHPNSGAAGPMGEIGAIRISNYKVVYYSGGCERCGGEVGPRTKLDPPLVFDLDGDPQEAHPLGGELAQMVRRKAELALARLLADVRADNTSVADYASDVRARPCCDSRSPTCRCPWD